MKKKVFKFLILLVVGFVFVNPVKVLADDDTSTTENAVKKAYNECIMECSKLYGDNINDESSSRSMGACAQKCIDASNTIPELEDTPCHGIDSIVTFIKKKVFPLIQIIVPIILLALGTFDLVKAVIASDEKKIKEAQSTFIKRAIYAALVFFVTTIVTVFMSVIAKGTTDEVNPDGWAECWNSIK